MKSSRGFEMKSNVISSTTYRHRPRGDSDPYRTFVGQPHPPTIDKKIDMSCEIEANRRVEVQVDEGAALRRRPGQGLECGHVLAHIPFTALLIASADRGQTINRVDATGAGAVAPSGLQNAPTPP